jgi:RNA polymerase sigma-70 factor (ECF subfamily)
VGRDHAGRGPEHGGSTPDHRPGGAGLTDQLDAVFRDHWWAAVAVVTRLVGDLEVAEDAVQEACGAAMLQWPEAGIPDSPRAWLISVARHKALDQVRREAARPAKEAAATEAVADVAGRTPALASPEGDQLGLIFMCCHPALSLAARTALTLRAVGGLRTAEIAAAFLVPEPTMAQRLVRAKRKIRQAGIAMREPTEAERPARLAGVLRVIYLVFTEGHMATSGDGLVRADLCDWAIGLARELARLLPDEPEVAGLLALLVLTDARRAPRVGADGEPVQLADQDRRRWDAVMITEGRELVERALMARRPGPYQLQAAIAACHCDAASAGETDWRQIVTLYDVLMTYEPTPVMQANRAAAVAMAEGPEAGLAILTELAADPAVASWPPLHIARAELHRQLGETVPALASYRAAAELGVPDPQRAFIDGRIREILGR